MEVTAKAGAEARLHIEGRGIFLEYGESDWGMTDERDCGQTWTRARLRCRVSEDELVLYANAARDISQVKSFCLKNVWVVVDELNLAKIVAIWHSANSAKEPQRDCPRPPKARAFCMN